MRSGEVNENYYYYYHYYHYHYHHYYLARGAFSVTGKVVDNVDRHSSHRGDGGKPSNVLCPVRQQLTAVTCRRIAHHSVDEDKLTGGRRGSREAGRWEDGEGRKEK